MSDSVDCGSFEQEVLGLEIDESGGRMVIVSSELWFDLRVKDLSDGQ